MRSLLIAAVVGSLSVLGAAQAQADCMVQAWVGGEVGTHVPTRGVFYLHDESIGWDIGNAEPFLKIWWSGGEGTTKVVRVEKTLVTVEYEGPPGSTIHVGGRYEDTLAEFVLDETWATPVAAPRVLQYWHRDTSWTCSWADSLMVQVDQPVAAFRVRWYVNQHYVDYVETPRMEDGKVVLELGKINCGDENVPLEQLRDGVGIELYAIRYDGSEVFIPTMPAQIRLADEPSVDSGMPHAFTIIATQQPQAAPPPPRAKAKYSSDLGAVIVAFFAVGVLLALWLLRRAEKSASDCLPAS